MAYTPFNTGNPIGTWGSVDPRDLVDNAAILDRWVNDQTITQWRDRFGVQRLTWNGMEIAFQQAQDDRQSAFDAEQVEHQEQFDVAQAQRESDFNAFLLASGYQFIGDYDADGPLTISQVNQIFSKDGEFWRADPALGLPYTTINDWVTDEPNFVSVGDAVLRQDLANTTDPSKGAGMVGLATAASLQIHTVGEVLESLVGVFVDLAMFGGVYDGGVDGGTDNTDAIHAALANSKNVVLSGPAFFAGVVTVPPGSTLACVGDGRAFQLNEFCHMGDNHRLLYWKSKRALGADINTIGTAWRTSDSNSDLREWLDIGCEWDGYFYSLMLAGSTEHRISGVTRIRPVGIAPAGQNAGVFQHRYVSQVVVAFGRAYGGQNASSYNFVDDCRDVEIISCWEDGNNSYAGLEIENSPDANSRIVGGYFPSDVWIDDCAGVECVGVTSREVRITAQTIGSRNINVTGGTTGRVTIAQFGESPVQGSSAVLISGVVLNGNAPAGPAISISGPVECTVQGCKEVGTYAQSVRFPRNPDMNLVIKHNEFKSEPFSTGSGGVIVAYDNGVSFGTHSDARGLDRLSRRMGAVTSSGHGYAGSSAPATLPASGAVALEVAGPVGAAFTGRSGMLTITCRSSSGGALSTFSVPILMTNSSVVFGDKTSMVGNSTAIAVTAMSVTGQGITVNLSSSSSADTTVRASCIYTLTTGENL